MFAFVIRVAIVFVWGEFVPPFFVLAGEYE